VAHAGCPWTEDYNGPFQVAPDSTAVTLYEADHKTIKCVAPIDKELLELATPAETIHCILMLGYSDDQDRSGKLWVVIVYANINGKAYPVSAFGEMRVPGKNLVLTTWNPSKHLSLVGDE